MKMLVKIEIALIFIFLFAILGAVVYLGYDRLMVTRENKLLKSELSTYKDSLIDQTIKTNYWYDVAKELASNKKIIKYEN